MTMTNDERVQKYAAKLLEIKAQKQELEEAEKNYRDKIGELVSDGDNFIGEFKINRRQNKRFDASLAQKNLTSEELATISVLKPDSGLAKKFLDEDRLALAQKTFGNVVTVGLRED